MPSSRVITVEEVQRYRVNMKASRPPDEYVDAECKSLQKKIEGRDHMFLIDDSGSMKREHRQDVFNTFVALSYLGKKSTKMRSISSSHLNQGCDTTVDEPYVYLRNLN